MPLCSEELSTDVIITCRPVRFVHHLHQQVQLLAGQLLQQHHPRLQVKTVVKRTSGRLCTLILTGPHDLKPANILLTADFHAVLTDFGSASPLVEEVTNRAEALTIQDKAAAFTTASYRAPELHSTPSQCTIDGKTDVWSFGCCMYDIFYSRTPFESAVEGLSVLAIMSAHYSVPECNMWPADYLEVIERCLQTDPAQRLTVEELQLRLKRLSSPPLDLTPVAKPVSTSPRGPSAADSDPVSSTPSSPATTTTIITPSVETITTSATPGPLIQHGRTLSVNAGNFADFASEEATHVLSDEADNVVEAAPAKGVLDRQASRDVFGDKIQRNITAHISPAPFTAHSEDFAEDIEGEQEGEEFFNAAAEVDRGESFEKETGASLSLQSPAEVASQDSLPNGISRSQFTDSCSTNDTSYVNDFASQSTFTTFGNNSPAAFNASRVQRETSNGSFGEFVFMEQSTARGSASTPGGAGPGSHPSQSVNFSASAVSEDAWIIHEAIAASSRVQDKGSESGSASPVNVSDGVVSSAAREDFEEVDAFGDFADGSVNTEDPFHVVSTPTSTASSSQYLEGSKPQAFFATFPAVGEESLSEGRVTSPGSGDSAVGLKNHHTSNKLQTAVVPSVTGIGTASAKGVERGVEVVEPIDLHKVILGQSMSSSVSADSSGGLRMVLKEGSVNILRMTGFPKRLAKKQVWFVLTASGLVLRKDSSRDSKIHEVVSLHRPLYLTPTDTMTIGLHGLLMQGSSPRTLPSGAHHSHVNSALVPSSSGSLANGVEDDWVSVTLADLTIDAATSSASNSSNARVFKSMFSELRCEVSFASKDSMNDWIDAIEAQREVCCSASQ
eukprot:gene22555-28688_t